MSALPPIYFERLLEDSPDIIVAVDKHGAIVFFNDGARTALGYLPEEVLGKHVRMFYPSEADARAVMTAMRDDAIDSPGKVRNFKTTFVTRSGNRLNVAISGALIHDEHGNQIGSIGFAKDLAEIQRQDQLTTLGEIAIGVAHEINNPLFAVLNNVSLIGADMRRMQDDSLYDVQAERLDSIESSVNKIQRAVNRLAEMADGGTYGTREYLPGAQMTDLRSTGPETPTAPRVSTRPSMAGDGPLSGLRVLVADDDLAVCHSVAEILRGAGAAVNTVASGREAEVELTHAPYDLVLSDVVMPDVDGYDLYMHVREHYPAIPVVLMTAFFYDRDHIIKRAKVAGLDGVIFKKPVDAERLIDTVRERCGLGAR
ncbi:response regulator [Candidatus Binatia bacterium]|jgi:PAS domain S-box-containing protein|nr:response regulator [Candidatus Binatia bacterium]